MLQLVDVKSGYGKVEIIHGVNLEFERGERVAVIGRNGVGKTTLMKTVMGALPLNAGSIHFDGKDFSRMPAYRRSEYGVAFVEQGHGIFPDLTVDENLLIVAKTKGLAKNAVFDVCYERFPIIGDRRKQKAGTLSGGEQAILSIARAMVSEPELIILDEPSEGVQPSVVEEIGKILKRLNEENGVTILLVEQNLKLIQQLAQKCFVLDKGVIKAIVEEDDIRDADKINAYLTVS